MKYFVKVVNGDQMPISNDDYRKSLKVKDNDFLCIETWKDRNIQYHRKYFALLNCCINHLPEDEQFDRFRNVDSLRHEIMYQNGRFKIHRTLGGKESYEPHSISFKSMDNIKFEEIYNEAINTILKYFLKHISKEDFENDILNFL